MRITANHFSRVAILLIAIAILPRELCSQATTKTAAVFRQLGSLVGDWQGIQDGVPIKVTYTLTANGTALMEQMQPGNESPMITMFTIDGDHLIATHYCSLGNQPNMVSGIPGNLETGLTFALARITGMKTPDDWHNTGLTVTLADSDHMTQRWTYQYKGQNGTNLFHYVRKK